MTEFSKFCMKSQRLQPHQKLSSHVSVDRQLGHIGFVHDVSFEAHVIADVWWVRSKKSRDIRRSLLRGDVELALQIGTTYLAELTQRRGDELLTTILEPRAHPNTIFNISVSLSSNTRP